MALGNPDRPNFSNGLATAFAAIAFPLRRRRNRQQVKGLAEFCL